MKPAVLTAAAFAVFLFAAPLALACSKTEAQGKADAVSARLQHLAKQNPQKLKAVLPKVEQASVRLRTALEKNPNDLAEICRYFDDLLSEMN